MQKPLSRRSFIATAAAAVPLGMMQAQVSNPASSSTSATQPAAATGTTDRIVDIHCHFDAKNPNFIDDFLKVSDHLNLTACMLTPFEHRKVVAEAAKNIPSRLFPSVLSTWMRRMWRVKWKSFMGWGIAGWES